MKLLKVLLVSVIGFTLVGCNQKDNSSNLNQDYYDEIAKIVTEKGYTVEEISELKVGQEVKKDYDNEVLARFGKIQGYLYEVTSKWNDGLIEGPFTDKTKEYSVLSLKEMKEVNKDSYEDSKHFNKYTIKLSKRVIFDSYYNEDLSECYWQLGKELNNSGTCKSALPKEYLEEVKSNRILRKAITQSYTDGVQVEEGIQLKLPTLKDQ